MASSNGKPAADEGYVTALGLMQRYDKPGNLDRAIQALQNSIKPTRSSLSAMRSSAKPIG